MLKTFGITKVAIVGSRDYKNLDQVKEFIEAFPEDTIIVSGGAIGVDTIAEEKAEELGLKIKIFFPDWAKFKKAAGPIRNKKIVDYADLVVAFWRKKSKGTGSTIKLALEAKKPIIIFSE